MTVYFWIVKVLTTALGESTSDYLVHRFDPVTAVLGAAVVFVVTLLVQLGSRRYIPWRYWLAVVMVAVFGTMCADVLHIRFRVPYGASATMFAVVLAAVFVTWWASERTLSIHSVVSLRRELFYWAAVVATFALGTAVGDLTATTFHLGYLVSGLVFAGAMVLPALGYRLARWNGVFAFWFAYILTRPLGASFADWTGKPHSVGGLAWGDGPVALVLALCVAGLVAFLTVSRADTPDSPGAPGAAVEPAAA